MISELRRSITEMNPKLAQEAVQQALSIGIPPNRIIDDGLGKGMAKIGQEFNDGKLFLPQILAASKAMDAGIELLTPVIERDSRSGYRGTVIMGSVQGDIHEIGKNVCCAMLRGAGYKVIDLGSDVSPDKFILSARKNHADIIGASALMTTTLVAQKDLIRHIREENENFETAIGGAPCSQSWCDEIGASGYSASAGEIVKLVERLQKREREKRDDPESDEDGAC